MTNPPRILSHGRQEALRVEEPHHPETVWSSLEYPAPGLGVPLQGLIQDFGGGGGKWEGGLCLIEIIM